MNRDDKARALLAERRVRILTADELSVVADVTGDSALYRVGVTLEGNRLACECSCSYSTEYHPIKADCSHVRAVLYVWRPDRREGP